MRTGFAPAAACLIAGKAASVHIVRIGSSSRLSSSSRRNWPAHSDRITSPEFDWGNWSASDISPGKGALSNKWKGSLMALYTWPACDFASAML